MIDDPAYVAMIQARIAIAFDESEDLSRAAFAAHLRETPSVETMVLEGDTILFNRNYATVTGRSPAGRKQLAGDIVKLFKEPADA